MPAKKLVCVCIYSVCVCVCIYTHTYIVPADLIAAVLRDTCEKGSGVCREANSTGIMAVQTGKRLGISVLFSAAFFVVLVLHGRRSGKRLRNLALKYTSFLSATLTKMRSSSSKIES